MCKNKVEVIMREKNNYFKLVCWVCVCVFIITGCSNNRSTEEKIFMEGEKEEVERLLLDIRI